MKLSRSTLSVALLAALVAPAAHAEIALDVIGGSEISFEGLVQADYNYFDNDFANLNGDAPDGNDSDNELRRAELVLKGKGPGNIEWVLGYDAKADKWLDVNVKYKLGGNANHLVPARPVQAAQQPGRAVRRPRTTTSSPSPSSPTPSASPVASAAPTATATNDWGVTASYFGRELTRIRTDAARPGLRRARQLGADQREGQHPALRPVVRRLRHRRRHRAPARPSGCRPGRPAPRRHRQPDQHRPPDDHRRRSDVGHRPVQGAGRVHAVHGRPLRQRQRRASRTTSTATASTSAACGTSPARPGATRTACRPPRCPTTRPAACGRSACATTRST